VAAVLKVANLIVDPIEREAARVLAVEVAAQVVVDDAIKAAERANMVIHMAPVIPEICEMPSGELP
jgi:hypothetical protein